MGRTTLVVLVVAAALAAPASAAPETQSALSALAGTTVACWASSDWSGETTAIGLAGAKGVFDEDARTISLPVDSCTLLLALGAGYRPHRQLLAFAVAEAVFVFGHELAHASGIADEAAADCTAEHGLPALARRLGTTRAYANELAGYAVGAVGARLPAACRPSAA